MEGDNVGVYCYNNGCPFKEAGSYECSCTGTCPAFMKEPQETVTATSTTVSERYLASAYNTHTLIYSFWIPVGWDCYQCNNCSQIFDFSGRLSDLNGMCPSCGAIMRSRPSYMNDTRSFTSNKQDTTVEVEDMVHKDNIREGDYVIYQNGDTFQIGRVKTVKPNGVFVYYHEGDTAAKTPLENLHVIQNSYVIEQTSLGGAVHEE